MLKPGTDIKLIQPPGHNDIKTAIRYLLLKKAKGPFYSQQQLRCNRI